MMRNAMRAYIRAIDRMNRRLGRMTMYLIFALMGVLLWSSLSKTLLTPAAWTLETAQFVMVAYYVLGGPYSIQLGSNVRMDLFYGGWTTRTKAWVDAFTIFFLLFYLVILFIGAVSSTAYSLGYFGTEPFAFFGDLFATTLTDGISGARQKIGFLERSPTAWRPRIWPIKVVLCIGVLLMILQCIAEFFRDLERLKAEGPDVV